MIGFLFCNYFCLPILYQVEGQISFKGSEKSPLHEIERKKADGYSYMGGVFFAT
jgi:hypothetical protein